MQCGCSAHAVHMQCSAQYTCSAVHSAHAHAHGLALLPQDIFRKEKLEKLADGLRPYTIQSTSSQTGLVEAMTDAQSVDSVKRRMLKASTPTPTLALTLRLTTDPDPNPDPHPNQASKPTSLEYYYRQRFDPSQAR